MATRPEQTTGELKVDPASLYQEEIFTDRRVGTIRRLTPIKKDGARDTARAVLYVGETQVLTPAGALPIGFEIGAGRSEEHTSELQSRVDLVCRLLLEKKR